MSSTPRRARTPVEVQQAFREQLELLVHTCTNFDQGHLVVGKQLATSLRTILYAPAPKGNRRTVPLVQQVNLTGRRFYDTAYSIDPARLTTIQGVGRPPGPVPCCALLDLQVDATTAEFFSPLDDCRGDWIPYSEWLTMPVSRDKRARTASRLDLVKLIADTDGGAHVDEGVPEQLHDWKNGHELGWYYTVGGGEKQRVKHMELHCMRQIAHEVLRSVERAAPTLAVQYPQKMPRLLPDSSSFRDGLVLLSGAVFMLEDTDMVISCDA